MDIIVKDGNAYVAMTAGRIAAVKTALDILRRDHANYLDGAFSVGYGEEVHGAITPLEAIVEDAELEERWQSATFLDDKPDGWSGVANA